MCSLDSSVPGSLLRRFAAQQVDTVRWVILPPRSAAARHDHHHISTLQYNYLSVGSLRLQELAVAIPLFLYKQAVARLAHHVEQSEGLLLLRCRSWQLSLWPRCVHALIIGTSLLLLSDQPQAQNWILRLTSHLLCSLLYTGHPMKPHQMFRLTRGEFLGLPIDGGVALAP